MSAQIIQFPSRSRKHWTHYDEQMFEELHVRHKWSARSAEAQIEHDIAIRNIPEDRKVNLLRQAREAMALMRKLQH